MKNVLQPGKYTLSIRFQSRIVERPHGLFLQPYKDGELAATEHLLATELQTDDTRRIFPCWDESTFRATFQLSVKTGKENTVISNMPVFVEHPLGPDQKIVVFEKTPLIASDMVLLVCGKLEWLDDEVAGVKLRIVTTPGKKELGKYAMEVTKQLLTYFSNYFAIPFPLSKAGSDSFAVRRRTSRKTWVELSTTRTRCSVIRRPATNPPNRESFWRIADKIAHQWWGDLVTMTSRNDLWLNEGFESWLAKKAADHCHPQWKIWLQAARKKEATMACDAGEMTHAIQASLAGEEQTMKASDVIMNQKPWLLLRMLENFTGEDPFRDGVRAYLATHQSSETTAEDLWTSLEQVTGKPIKKMVVGWAEQPGFPLIKITTQCVNGNRVISLEQVPFVLAQRDEPPTQWGVPVGIRPNVSSNEVKYALLDKLSDNFDLTGCSGVIQANAGNVGYFRVLYEPTLLNDLQKNVEKLPESDRLNLITDTWALVESGNLPASTYFELLEESASRR